MIVRLAVRSLVSRPLRSAVLAGGFGLGVAVMAALLGIGGVILEQARDPALAGGGDVAIGGASGRLTSPRFVLSEVIGGPRLRPSVIAAAPTRRASLYLMTGDRSIPVRATGSIPSLDRALGDPEVAGIAAWRDSAADRDWSNPDPASVLRAIDGFHAIPDVPSRAGSWAEWLYFNGHAGTARFYLTFLAGPETEPGRRGLGVRLQLERDGRMASYSDSATVDAEVLLRDAPDLTVGGNAVRLVGREYRIELDLPAEAGDGRVVGTLVIRAEPGRAAAPLVMRGAGGWLSGYVVPVMSGALEGSLRVGAATIDFSGGTGYHDHNWGFWEGVRWQWGQVQGDGLAFVYGRVFPPADAADASRVPGFLVAIGPDGPIGYATNVGIDEADRAGAAVPERITVRGRSRALDLTLEIDIGQDAATRMSERSFGSGMTFLQMRGTYHVSGRVADRHVEFTAPGSAETFRGLSASR